LNYLLIWLKVRYDVCMYEYMYVCMPMISQPVFFLSTNDLYAWCFYTLLLLRRQFIYHNLTLPKIVDLVLYSSSMVPRSVRFSGWSVIVWVTKKLLFRAPPCFGRHVKPLVPTEIAVVSTHKPVLVPRIGLFSVLLVCNP
jgi:hypothetical protein